MKKLPRILLIGAGRFGQHHLRLLKKLAAEKKIKLVGVVTKNSGPRLTPSLLKSLNAVIIVTPSQTHYALAKKCLSYTSVFVEKPLALKSEQAAELIKLARRHERVLFVGHIYRFHPVVQKLKSLLATEDPRALKISGRFVSPLATWKKENPALEKLHFFDIIDYLWPAKPISIWTKWFSKSLMQTDLRYQNGLTASFVLGWQPGENKERTLEIETPKARYRCDLPTGLIEREKNKGWEKVNCPTTMEPLELEYLAFLGALAGKKAAFPDGVVGARIVDVAVWAAVKRARKTKPKIAIIGGGIFGLTAALFLAKRHQVTIFEREADIMLGASRKNQYRHHVGYHYPRSMETIEEIQKSTKDFEDFYGAMIQYDLPSYYAVEKNGSHVTGEQFIKVCERMGLPYEIKFPGPEMLNQERVDVCVLTPEAVINYGKLTAWLKRQIAKNENIVLKTGSGVVGARLGRDGKKILMIKQAAGRSQDEFDYVLNATYSNYNHFCNLLRFPKRNLELRFKEVVVVKLPAKNPVAVTVMDGPFATLVPIDKTGLYTFGDVPLSMHAIADGADGDKVFEGARRRAKTRWLEMRERCLKWFPILRQAEYVESMFVTLPVEKSAAGTDARPTELTSHGFGCWSILGGKIITSVSTAKSLLAKLIDVEK